MTLAHEFQRGDVVLGAGERVDRHEPGAQRQLGGRQQRAGDERGLVLAGTALVVHLPSAAEGGAAPIAAGRAAETLRPAGLVQRTAALGFGAVASDELDHRQAGLELHEVHGHDRDSGVAVESSSAYTVAKPATRD